MPMYILHKPGVNLIGAATRDNLTAVTAVMTLLPREILLACVTGLLRGKYPLLNIHGSIKKNKKKRP